MNARIVLPKQMDGSPGYMTAELAHGNPATTIFWHLDNTYLTQTQDFHKISLQPTPGKHSLTVRYEDALNDESALQKQKFEFIVYIDGEEMGKGAGGSKKEAQQMAAKVAYKKLITNK